MMVDLLLVHLIVSCLSRYVITYSERLGRIQSRVAKSILQSKAILKTLSALIVGRWNMNGHGLPPALTTIRQDPRSCAVLFLFWHQELVK